LEVFQRAMDAAMRVFEISKTFPKEETYSLTDQVRRASRSVCANLAEAWRKGGKRDRERPKSGMHFAMANNPHRGAQIA
jgi:four helix bundle protein